MYITIIMMITTGYHVFWRIWKLTKDAKSKWNDPKYKWMTQGKIRIGNFYFDTMPFLKYRLGSVSEVSPAQWKSQCEIADQG